MGRGTRSVPHDGGGWCIPLSLAAKAKDGGAGDGCTERNGAIASGAILGLAVRRCRVMPSLTMSTEFVL